MYDDCHSVFVCCAKHAPQLLDMRRVIELDVRIAEVKLDPVAQAGFASTAIKLRERVLLQRIEATECAKPLGILRRLRSCPIVLGANLESSASQKPLISVVTWTSDMNRQRA